MKTKWWVLTFLAAALLRQSPVQAQQVACDFTSGSGWFVTGASRVSFGLAAGVKNGSLFGHLVYFDRGIGLKAKSLTITAYFALDAQTRVVEGTAETNLFGQLLYRVTATDNGEPGLNDIFQIELQNGYFARGTLGATNPGAGNIDIQEGNASSTPPPGSTCQPGDTSPPVVSITSPTDGSTVSGTITVSAKASDNVGVAGVQFKLDGANLGAEDTVSPYSVNWDTTTATNGTHTLTAVARDGAGNTATSSPIPVTVSNQTATPPNLIRIQENDPAVTYTGTWFSNTNGVHSGGSARLAMDPASRASLTFNGTGVRWIGYRDQWSGIAHVFVDGTFVAVVDTFSSTAQAQTVIFSVTGLASATHRLAVEATGTQNASSGGAWIWVDAFDVESGAAPPPSDTTPPTVSITSPANGSTVSGTLSVTADASDDVGVAGVQFKLDGANLGAEDTTAPYSVSWNTTSTPDGQHTLTAVARDGAGNTTTSSPVTVTVSNAGAPPPSTAPARFEDNDPAVTYTGTWSSNTQSLHSGGSAHLAMDAGFKATFSFNGSGVHWIGYRDEWSGIARVFLDGVLQGEVDTFASPAKAQAVIFSASGLPSGSHTLVIEVTGKKSLTSAGSWIWVDAFDVESAAADTSPPTVSITSPASGSTVSGTITVSADASDNVGVAGVQFKLDGANLGAEDTTAPYSVPWDTTTAANDQHTLTAVARDGAGNTATSSPVTVTVSNPAPQPGQGFQAGDVFVALGNGQVQWRDSNGTLKQTLTSVTEGAALGMAFDAAGNLYVTHHFGTQTPGNTVAKFDPNGNLLGTFGETCTATPQTPAAPSCYNSDPESIDFDAAGNGYVGQATGAQDILKFDPAGNLIGRFDVAVQFQGSNWIDLAPDGCTMFYTSKLNDVLRYNVCTNTQLPNFNTAPLPGSNAYTVKILPDGGVLVADAEVIVRLDASGNLVQTYDVTTEATWWQALDLVGDGSFWAVNGQTSNVYRFDLTTGNVLASFNTGTPAFSAGGTAVKR